MRALVEVVQKGGEVKGSEQERAAREQVSRDLATLRGWYVDWAETARTVLKRRDQLIRLGLPKRVGRKPAAPGSGETIPTTPASFALAGANAAPGLALT